MGDEFAEMVLEGEVLRLVSPQEAEEVVMMLAASAAVARLEGEVVLRGIDGHVGRNRRIFATVSQMLGFVAASIDGPSSRCG